MVGSAIKKFAGSNDLTIKNGVAFGYYKGYFITLSDGYGIKSASICVNLQGSPVKAEIASLFSNNNYKKQYRVAGSNVTDDYIDISFTDNGFNTMKRIGSFLEMFVHELSVREVSNLIVCPGCGQQFYDNTAVPVLINGRVQFMHNSCVETYNENVSIANAEAKKEGSVLTGAVGAIIGGLVGSIPWAIAYYFGWFVGWLGFLIGIAAKKGYELLHGKASKAKGIIIILVTAVCVVLAELVTNFIGLKIGIANDPELAAYSLTTSEILNIFFRLITEDAELKRQIVADVVLGFIFAGLGIGSVARDIFKETDKDNGKVIRLDR